MYIKQLHVPYTEVPPTPPQTCEVCFPRTRVFRENCFYNWMGREASVLNSETTFLLVRLQMNSETTFLLVRLQMSFESTFFLVRLEMSFEATVFPNEIAGHY